MAEQTHIEKSLIDQILDEMFVNVEGKVEFNNKTIQNLKQLVISGNLKKANEVIKALKSEAQEII